MHRTTVAECGRMTTDMRERSHTHARTHTVNQKRKQRTEPSDGRTKTVCAPVGERLADSSRAMRRGAASTRATRSAFEMRHRNHKWRMGQGETLARVSLANEHSRFTRVEWRAACVLSNELNFPDEHREHALSSRGVGAHAPDESEFGCKYGICTHIHNMCLRTAANRLLRKHV